MSKRTKIKSFVQSKTIQAILALSLAGLIPVVDRIRERKFIDVWEDGFQVLLVSLGAITATVGRVQADSLLYTPNGVVGPNKADLEHKLLNDELGGPT